LSAPKEVEGIWWSGGEEGQSIKQAGCWGMDAV
jgi:hypothetical protein